MKTIAYRLVDDLHRLVLAIPEIGGHVTVDGKLETSDPHVIAALDANPAVERAPKGDAPKADPKSNADPKGDS